MALIKFVFRFVVTDPNPIRSLPRVHMKPEASFTEILITWKSEWIYYLLRKIESWTRDVNWLILNRLLSSRQFIAKMACVSNLRDRLLTINIRHYGKGKHPSSMKFAQRKRVSCLHRVDRSNTSLGKARSPRCCGVVANFPRDIRRMELS